MTTMFTKAELDALKHRVSFYGVSGLTGAPPVMYVDKLTKDEFIRLVASAGTLAHLHDHGASWSMQPPAPIPLAQMDPWPNRPFFWCMWNFAVLVCAVGAAFTWVDVRPIVVGCAIVNVLLTTIATGIADYRTSRKVRGMRKRPGLDA